MTNFSPPWLLCIHNIPPKPAYLRAKEAKRLASLGAVPVKNAVYILPDGEKQRDALLWLTKEIEEGGGRAYVCAASFDITGSGLDNAFIKSLFVDAREKEYRELFAQFQPMFAALEDALPSNEEVRSHVHEWTADLRRHVDAIIDIDFFGAPSREAVEGILSGTGRWLRAATAEEGQRLDPAQYVGRTWVTRPGVHVDRIATAWLVRRFIDPEATFRFDGCAVQADEVGFDMPGAEFTHEGSQCTFEVVVRRFFTPIEPALQALSDIVHDIDVNEEKPLRPESVGLAALLHGLCLRVADDHQRLKQGMELFEGMYEHFKRQSARKDNPI